MENEEEGCGYTPSSGNEEDGIRRLLHTATALFARGRERMRVWTQTGGVRACAHTRAAAAVH
eukprot:6178039-Pleurochrysis_carterae.AAC.1